MECRFLFCAHHLMMVYICTKFHENILNGIRVVERTQKVNRRTDGCPDRQTEGRRARHNTTHLRQAYKKVPIYCWVDLVFQYSDDETQSRFSDLPVTSCFKGTSSSKRNPVEKNNLSCIFHL